MRRIRLHPSGLAVVALLAALLAPRGVTAQSQLDVSEAREFLGDWTISLQTDFGPMVLQMKIEDRGGKVAATVGSPDIGGMTEVTDITKDGTSLVLRYDVDAQGQIIDVLMSLEQPTGDTLNTFIEAAGGQFQVGAVATRAAS
ncbi:MAG TPA: hypothetical protein VFQ22_04855 [Longimicrobiales bacterium]|nr:hypothetical protein [Longimicrobiales bacterium]